MMKRGTKIICIDPRITWLGCREGNWTIQLKPGTDACLALGLLNVIISEELYDHDFVENWCFGFDELKERGVFLDEIRKESGQDQMSDFDLICHIAYDQKPLTRSERANNVKKKGYLYEYTGVARDVLETLLDKYATSNLVDLDDTRVLDLEEFRQFGSPMKICKAFGGKKQFIYAVQTLENALYSA